MTELTYLFDAYYEFIFIAMFVLFVLAIICFFVVLSRLNKTRRTYQTLLKGMEHKNLEAIILENKTMIDSLYKNYQSVNQRMDEIDKALETSLRNVALERYDAFTNIGGQQSFTIALLDDSATGIVITTIHGREDSRTYAKHIVRGMSKFTLSEEEKKAIDKAVNS